MGRGALLEAGIGENLTYLASSIDDLSCEILVLPLDHLAEGVLDGRVVAVDKVTVDELHRHTRLACINLCQLYLRCKVAEHKAHSLHMLTDSSTADNGHLSLLGRSGHLVGSPVVSVCVFTSVLGGWTVSCSRFRSTAGTLMPRRVCEVDPGS